jgi:hypothetical protein
MVLIYLSTRVGTLYLFTPVMTLLTGMYLLLSGPYTSRGCNYSLWMRTTSGNSFHVQTTTVADPCASWIYSRLGWPNGKPSLCRVYLPRVASEWPCAYEAFLLKDRKSAMGVLSGAPEYDDLMSIQLAFAGPGHALPHRPRVGNAIQAGENREQASLQPQIQ